MTCKTSKIEELQTHIIYAVMITGFEINYTKNSVSRKRKITKKKKKVHSFLSFLPTHHEA